MKIEETGEWSTEEKDEETEGGKYGNELKDKDMNEKGDEGQGSDEPEYEDGDEEEYGDEYYNGSEGDDTKEDDEQVISQKGTHLVPRHWLISNNTGNKTITNKTEGNSATNVTETTAGNKTITPTSTITRAHRNVSRAARARFNKHIEMTTSPQVENTTELTTPTIKAPVSNDSTIVDHIHFGQGFGDHIRADGAVMGPMNWQSKNYFSMGLLGADGVRFGGRCCGSHCRNGGIGCCGKCPYCLDCLSNK